MSNVLLPPPTLPVPVVDTGRSSGSPHEQVFVDSSGRRRRWVRRTAAATGVSCVAYLGVLAAALSGGAVDPTSPLPLVDVMAPLVADVPASGAGAGTAGTTADPKGPGTAVRATTSPAGPRPTAPRGVAPGGLVADLNPVQDAMLTPDRLQPAWPSTTSPPAAGTPDPTPRSLPGQGTGGADPGTADPAPPGTGTPPPVTTDPAPPATGTPPPGTADPAPPGTGTPPPASTDPTPADPGTSAPGAPPTSTP